MLPHKRDFLSPLLSDLSELSKSFKNKTRGSWPSISSEWDIDIDNFIWKILISIRIWHIEHPQSPSEFNWFLKQLRVIFDTRRGFHCWTLCYWSADSCFLRSHKSWLQKNLIWHTIHFFFSSPWSQWLHLKVPIPKVTSSRSWRMRKGGWGQGRRGRRGTLRSDQSG